MTVESAFGADVYAGVGVGVDVGALGDSVVIEVGPCYASARVTCGADDETWRAGTVTVKSAVGADVCVGVGVYVGALRDSIVIEVGACDASARVTCGVNDET